MGQINLPSNLLDRIKRAEQSITELWKSIGLSSATIAAGGLTLINNAFFKMLGATNNEIVYIGPDGLGNQVVRIKDAAGNIIFGSVSTGTGGQRVAINPDPAGSARIDLYDDGTSTDHVSLNMLGGNFVMQRETNAVRAISGGKTSYYQGQSFFGHQLAATGADSYINFFDDEGILVRGKISVNQTISGHSALFVGVGSVIAGGPITWTKGYGATMVSTMLPIVARVGAAADSYFAVTASSSTSFDVAANAGSSNQFHYWVFRT